MIPREAESFCGREQNKIYHRMKDKKEGMPNGRTG
jgi:hypothetical protein